MKRDRDGLPVVGTASKELGVRIPPNENSDVDLDGGAVRLNGRGMSVAADWRYVRPHLIPKRLRAYVYGAAGPNSFTVYRFGEGAFEASQIKEHLALAIKEASTQHGNIIPTSEMSMRSPSVYKWTRQMSTPYLGSFLPLVLCLCLLSTAVAAEGDWPAWRGSRRDGRSDETGLLKSWPEGGPKLLWEAEGLGEGFSTPSFAGPLAYLMGNKDGQEWVLAIDRGAMGKGLWATAIGPVRRDGGGYPGPRSTPTVDGNRVFALGLNGDLVCLDAKTGKTYWRHDLVGEFGGEIGNWGYAESVFVDGKFVLCTPGGDRATMLGLLKTNGKPVWRSVFGDVAGYASMIAVQVDGTKQYVQFTSRAVVGVSAKNGSLLWRYEKPANGTANCATPLFADDSVFAASNYDTGGGLVKLQKGRKTWEANEVYFTREMNNHHGGMVLIDGHLYGCDNAILRCLDFETGKTLWKDRSCGKCSLIYADGMLYCRGEDGLVSLVAATADGFQLKGRFEQPHRSDRQAWPHPVIAGGCLYLRDQDRLLCYDVRNAK